MATYVSLVNNAIDESGADLALYAEDGSDFTTNTEPMLNRFKTWVARAWKTVQQVAFDWEFLNNQALVTLQPGLMFYTETDIATAVPPATIDIFGTDDALLYNDVAIGTSYKDLTFTQYSDVVGRDFGYLDLDASGSAPASEYSFKAGGDYFHPLGVMYEYTVGAMTPAPTFFADGIEVGDFVYIGISSLATYNGVMLPKYLEPVSAQITSMNPNTNDAARGTSGFTFRSNSVDFHGIMAAGSAVGYVYKNTNTWTGFTVGEVYNDAGTPTGYSAQFGSLPSPSIPTITFIPNTAYLHSWKSFLFSEESSSNDYVHEVSEIDNNSFHIIDHEADSPSTTRPLTFVPWHIFSVQYDSLTTPPSTPIYITEDNTGRWRLYPHPDRPVTLKFSYSRTPQNLVEWDDEPKGLPADFTDLVMWLAVRMYGEFDEQPSVARRAERYYKDLLQRLQIKYRPKFHIKPKRLY